MAVQGTPCFLHMLVSRPLVPFPCSPPLALPEENGYQRSGACHAFFRPLTRSLNILFIYELVLGLTEGIQSRVSLETGMRLPPVYALFLWSRDAPGMSLIQSPCSHITSNWPATKREL